MSRPIPAGFRPFLDLQRSLPRGTPFRERAAAARRLANRAPAERSNPSSGMKTLLLVGGAGLLIYLVSRQRQSVPQA